jgi:hypothetical protein
MTNSVPFLTQKSRRNGEKVAARISEMQTDREKNISRHERLSLLSSPVIGRKNDGSAGPNSVLLGS